MALPHASPLSVRACGYSHDHPLTCGVSDSHAQPGSIVDPAYGDLVSVGCELRGRGVDRCLRSSTAVALRCRAWLTCAIDFRMGEAIADNYLSHWTSTGAIQLIPFAHSRVYQNETAIVCALERRSGMSS
jgi:hypothetical protein